MPFSFTLLVASNAAWFGQQRYTMKEEEKIGFGVMWRNAHVKKSTASQSQMPILLYFVWFQLFHLSCAISSSQVLGNYIPSYWDNRLEVLANADIWHYRYYVALILHVHNEIFEFTALRNTECAFSAVVLCSYDNGGKAMSVWRVSQFLWIQPILYCIEWHRQNPAVL